MNETIFSRMLNFCEALISKTKFSIILYCEKNPPHLLQENISDASENKIVILKSFYSLFENLFTVIGVAITVGVASGRVKF